MRSEKKPLQEELLVEEERKHVEKEGQQQWWESVQFNDLQQESER